MMPLVWALVGGILGTLIGVVIVGVCPPMEFWLAGLIDGGCAFVGWCVGLMVAVRREP